MPVLYVHAFSPQKQRINLQIYATSSFVTNEWEGKKRPFCETCDETGYSELDLSTTSPRSNKIIIYLLYIWIHLMSSTL